ncbi:GNAT acetyltransferase, Mec-17 [Popillia japonica]|uniref:Alpha-tubulin N-acetyltransferase n=1 Tax=Popillia japonica TaxID=7064 RepID=A0AAW1MWG2_POPJA
MEFRFNVNEVFKQPIVEINSSLIPPGLSLADKRALWDAVSKVSDVVNAMGEASATAQGLTKPITTSDRLRNSEHKLYLLIDQNANNGKGAVTGMLKTGKKGLYVFDRDGHHYQVQPSCVLDFYIHETKQRMGLGKKLFEHMLTKEQSEPVKMAIDRPSDKFLGFLNKHYSLNNPVRQIDLVTNFLVFSTSIIV